MTETFAKLGGLNTEAATPADESLANTIANGRLCLPKFEQIPGFMQPKDWPIALVGGGPSLRRHLTDLAQFPTIMACGSVHDFLIEQGIVPTFAVACDPDTVTQAYFQNPTQKAIYLLAMHCNPGLFDHLAGYRIVTWNCYTDDPRFVAAWTENDGSNWHAVGGGCTVGLRALSLAMMLGFRDIHFFGFDSCVEQVEGEVLHHAYGYATDREQMQTVYSVKTGIDGPGDRTYVCEGYQLAQAYHFKQFVTAHGHKFKATFHGGGMMSDWYDTYLAGVARRIEELSPEEREQYEKELAA